MFLVLICWYDESINEKNQMEKVMCMLKKSCFILVMNTMFFIILPGAAYGHSVLEESDPADGDQLEQGIKIMELSYSTKIENESTLSLRSEDGQEIQPSSVDLNDNVMSASFDESLRPGVYDVNWNIIGADGHPIDGQYSFSILGSSNQVKENDNEVSEVESNKQNLDANITANQQDTSGDETSSLGMIIVIIIASIGLILAGGMWIRKKQNRK